MKERPQTSEDPIFQSLSAKDRQMVWDFLMFSSRSEARESAVEQHLMIALNFALSGRTRAC